MARRAKAGALGACFDIAQMLPWWIGTLLAGGFVVTSGVFTKEAHAFASGRNIELLDGPALVAMIGRTPRDAPIEDRPLQDTRTAEPARARPVPFCRQGLRPPPRTSDRVLVQAVP